jgi:NAD(P)H-flavin reductase
VATCRQVGAYTMLGLVDRDGPEPLPGQFYMLATEKAWGAGEDERPFLPRAFSAMGANDGQLWFMLEDIGPGTHRLTGMKKGEGVWVTGPLGHGFTTPPEGARPVLVAGGIGLPPMVAWSRALAADGIAHELLLGFRDAAHAAVAASFDAQIATDDGSVGHHGYVTELIPPDAYVYACGPPGLLEAIRRMDVPAQLALEAGMACGYGACFGCVTPLAAGGYARVCVDGPVFDAAALAEVPAH